MKDRIAAPWLAIGWLGAVLLPWHMIDAGFFAFGWLKGYPGPESGPAIWQIAVAGEWWLLPSLLPLLAATWAVWRGDERMPDLLVQAGITGIVLALLQGFLIDHRGWTLSILGAGGPKQAGMGYGALALCLSYLMMMCRGLALRGFCRGDTFVVGSIALVVALISLFVLFPVLTILASAFQDNQGNLSFPSFWEKVTESSIWGLDCLTSNLRCGVAWNTLFLAILTGAGTTLLGLAFALIAVRSGFRFKGLLRVMSVLPIITPPFVIGLAVILLFGRAGLVSTFLYEWFDVPRSRWIYGLTGVFLAQLLAFTPIAFLVLIGVVQGIAPSL